MAVAVGIALAVSGMTAPHALAAPAPRLDLRVLVVSDGSPWLDGIQQELATEGVPTTVLDLGAADRPTITADYLADQANEHARFDGVVLPNEAPQDLTSTELAELAAFEQHYGVRQVDAFTYPTPAVGLNYPSFAGSLDGITATAGDAAVGDAFRYLRGPVPFEDNSPAVAESYGYLSSPLPDDATTGTQFVSYFTAPAPGGSGTGTVAGVYSSGGREQFVLSFAYNYYQRQFRLLAHGIVDWVTRGVHLGYWRNYLTVHVDDVLSADSRWSATGKCTPGEGDCQPGVPDNTPIRMTPADVTAAVDWEAAHGFTFDLLFNGAGSDEEIADNGSDPLTTALLADSARFRWVNHTYSHGFLGCVQDFSVIPWRCATDAAGQPVWTSRADVDHEIGQNLTWAQAHSLPVRPAELVAGEHSGTQILPQQPVDNPNFIDSLDAHGIGWLGLDASREPAQRQVGSALGLPRHPINVFYNVATEAEEISEYNWIYTSRANSGSGICEDHPDTTTCIAPLDPATGFTGYIVPTEINNALADVLGNDPRPFFLHQSNLTASRLAYPVLEGVLDYYHAAFADSAPVVNQTMTEMGAALRDQQAWQQALATGQVTASVQGGAVTVTGPAAGTAALTLPAGSTTMAGAPFGAGYGGEVSAYAPLGAGTVTFLVPGAGVPGGSAAPGGPRRKGPPVHWLPVLPHGLPAARTATVAGIVTAAAALAGFGSLAVVHAARDHGTAHPLAGHRTAEH